MHSMQSTHSVTACTVCTVSQYAQDAQYAQYAQHELRYTSPMSLLLANQSIHSQITDISDLATSVPSAVRSTECVSILLVAQFIRATCFEWVWHVRVV